MKLDFPFALDADDATPLFIRLARGLTDAILIGRLPPGSRLPGTRALATSAGVHRNTVLAAYAELVSEGWITSVAARGTFVASELPAKVPKRFAPNRRAPGIAVTAGYTLQRAHADDEAMLLAPLASAVPDAREVPAAALARAWRRASRRPRLFDYGDARGVPALRAGLASLVASTRGIAATADDVLITRGSQMGLDLAAQILVQPGDRVAVEALGYRPTRAALLRAGATLVPLPLDSRGVVVDGLQGSGVRAVFLTPHHQYPTAVTLAPERRLALLALAQKERFAIVEDDYDHEFHYDGRPIAPLASADTAGSVVYIGSLSKVLAPALRLGFVVAPRPMLERMLRARQSIDRQGDSVLEAAVAELIDDGELGRHVRRMRKIYAARRDACAASLRALLGDAITFRVPAGGMALWFEVDPDLDVEAWAGRARTLGGGFPTARWFACDGRARPAGRIAYAALTEAELHAQVKLLGRALRRRA